MSEIPPGEAPDVHDLPDVPGLQTEPSAVAAEIELLHPLKTTPRPSAFTVQNFIDLNNKEKSYNTPLAVIGHVDVNAFFAQVEQIRMGYSVDDPVVCVQWQTIIAVSYAARKYGISRLTTLDEAKKKCPHLILGHTAVFKKGESDWSYKDYIPSPIDHKVSLDPYRRESRKMLKIIKSFCPIAEKASVDESFLDLGKLIFDRARDLFPDLLGHIDPLFRSDDHMPLIPDELPSCLQWKGYIAHTETEVVNKQDSYSIEDWDDIFMLIGSQLGDELRRLIHRELGYFTSLGVARVKTMAKLASGFKKPDNQTIVRNSAINQFLTNFQFTDFWSMGGKTGEIIRQKLNIPEFETVAEMTDSYNGDHDYSNMDYNDDDEELLTQDHDRDINRFDQKKIDSIGYIRKYFTLKDLELKLNDNALAESLYKIIRGEMYTPLKERVDVKSMGSNKNFRGKSVNCSDDLVPWFKVYASDLCQRIQELDEESNSLRRPKTLSVSVTNTKAHSRSRQCPVPLLQDMERLEEALYQVSIKALKDLEASWDISIGKMYPAINCGVAVSKLEPIDNVKSLDHFFGKNVSKNTKSPRKEAASSKRETREPSITSDENPSTVEATKRNLQPLVYVSQKKSKPNIQKRSEILFDFSSKSPREKTPKPESDYASVGSATKTKDDSFHCEECNKRMPGIAKEEHLDWHVAKTIAQELNGSLTSQHYEDSYAARVFRSRNNKPKASPSSSRSAKKSQGNRKDTSQSRLPF